MALSWGAPCSLGPQGGLCTASTVLQWCIIYFQFTEFQSKLLSNFHPYKFFYLVFLNSPVCHITQNKQRMLWAVQYVYREKTKIPRNFTIPFDTCFLFTRDIHIGTMWGGVVGIIRMLANNEINNTFPCSVSRTRHAKSQNRDKKAAQNKKA